MQRGEVAQNGVRFPHHHVAIDERRYFHIRIELTVGVGVGVVELPAVILAGVFEADLLEQEQDFLHVARSLAAENTDHSYLLFDIAYCFTGLAAARYLSANAFDASMVCFIAPCSTSVLTVFCQVSSFIQPMPCACVSGLKNVCFTSASI